MIVELEDHLDNLDFAKGEGLLPLIAQHALTGEVLMLGYSNREALSRTLRQGSVWFYSRSRECLWQKGETSGNTLRLISLHADCDRDSLVALVEPSGPTCHTGERTCFAATPTLSSLAAVLDSRLEDYETGQQGGPGSYSVRLFGDANLRHKKLAEEALELALACASEDRAAVAEEAADLLYHLLVASRASGVSIESILEVLASRRAALSAAHE
jgi:phosphoribosyl-ATP pyrophosphohydrolase/phosphoribosyl-AMP cyclohydrolase